MNGMTDLPWQFITVTVTLLIVTLGGCFGGKEKKARRVEPVQSSSFKSSSFTGGKKKSKKFRKKGKLTPAQRRYIEDKLK